MGFMQSLARQFGFSRDKTAEQGYEGIRPAEYLTEVPGGQEYYKSLQDRMAGIGVGYPADFLSYNAPYAQTRLATLQNYELPTIAGAASARGLGRSSLVTNQMGLKTQEASRDIEQRIAEMSLNNEQQKRNEINTAVAGMGQFSQANATQRNIRANFDYNDWTRAINATAGDIAQQDQNAMGIPMLGAEALLAPATNNASLMSMPGTLQGNYSGMDINSLLAMQKMLSGGNAAMVDTGMGRVNAAPSNYYLSNAARA